MAGNNTYDTASDSGVYKQEYEAKLQERLNKPINWKEICNVIYTNSRYLNVPLMSSVPSVAVGTRGTAYAYTDFTLVNQAMDIGTTTIIPMYVDRADLAQCQYVQQMELAELQGNLINEAIETAVFVAADGATSTGMTAGSLVVGGSTVTVSATNIDDIIRGVRKIVTKYNGASLAARNGLFIVWRPEDFEMLEAFVQAGLKIIGLGKSLLIDLETLIQRATGGKQAFSFAA